MKLRAILLAGAASVALVGCTAGTSDAPLPGSALTRVADRLAASGDTATAAAIYRSAIALGQKSPETRRGYGNVLLALGDARGAITEFETALAEKKDARLYNGMGVAYDMLGEHERAQAYFRDGIALDPNHRGLIHNYGMSLAAVEKTDAAEKLDAIAASSGSTAPEPAAKKSASAVETPLAAPDSLSLRKTQPVKATMRDSVTPEQVAPRYVAPKIVATETVAAKTIATDTIATDTIATDTIAMGTIAMGTIAIGTIDVETVASPIVAPPTAVLETIAAENATVETVTTEIVALENVALEEATAPTVAAETVATPTAVTEPVAAAIDATKSVVTEPIAAVVTVAVTSQPNTPDEELTPLPRHEIVPIHSPMAGAPLHGSYFRFRLAGYISREAATQSWRDLAKRAPELQGTLYLVTEHPSLRAKAGLRYTLMSAPLPNLKAAESACGVLIERGLECTAEPIQSALVVRS